MRWIVADALLPGSRAGFNRIDQTLLPVRKLSEYAPDNQWQQVVII